MKKKHLKPITLLPKADNTAESLFFSLYFTVIYIMLTAAMAEKSS